MSRALSSKYKLIIQILAALLATIIIALLLLHNTEITDAIHRNSNVIGSNENYISNNSSSINIDNKCLIIIFGQVRAAKSTYHSFKKHVLNVTKCDVALCVGSIAYDASMTNNSYYSIAKYIWIWDEKKYNNIEKSSNFLLRLAFQQNESFPHTNITNSKMHWKNLFKIPGEWIHDQSKGITIWSDYKYICDFPMDQLTNNRTITNKIWITSGEEFSGITDRNLLTSNELFLNTLNITMDIFANYGKWIGALLADEAWNIEGILKVHLQLQNVWQYVGKYDQMMFLVRSNQTFYRHTIGRWDNTQKVFIRYQHEYERSLKTCNISI
eukprot:278119_1